MSTDKKNSARKKNSVAGKKEELKTNKDTDVQNRRAPLKTNKHETEGERRFKEGLVNNSDTDE